LIDCGCPARLLVNMTLVTSELVTNAVVHARSAPRVIAVIGSGRLRLEVHDTDAAPPVRRGAITVTGGRGLHVVEAVTESWGWSPTADGKYVWAEMIYEDLRHPSAVIASEEGRSAAAQPPAGAAR
jgi:anti-sigma regulatory factor (Ser/Thr protein kinase)